MLIPRFSTLGLFGVVTAGAFVALTVRFAYLKQEWAIAMVIAFAFLVFVMSVHSLFFLYTWIWSLIYRRLRPLETPKSPFATSGLPQQIIPPNDPD